MVKKKFLSIAGIGAIVFLAMICWVELRISNLPYNQMRFLRADPQHSTTRYRMADSLIQLAVANRWSTQQLIGELGPALGGGTRDRIVCIIGLRPAPVSDEYRITFKLKDDRVVDAELEVIG